MALPARQLQKAHIASIALQCHDIIPSSNNGRHEPHPQPPPRQALCFLAGANSIFDCDKLLTTPNNDRGEDEQLFDLLGLKSRPAFLPYASGAASSAAFQEAGAGGCGSAAATQQASATA